MSAQRRRSCHSISYSPGRGPTGCLAHGSAHVATLLQAMDAGRLTGADIIGARALGPGSREPAVTVDPHPCDRYRA